MTPKVTFKFDYNGRTETIRRSGFRYPEQVDEIARDMIVTGINGVAIHNQHELDCGGPNEVVRTYRSGPGLRYMVKLIAEEGVVPCDRFLSTATGLAVQAELRELGYSIPTKDVADPEDPNAALRKRIKEDYTKNMAAEAKRVADLKAKEEAAPDDSWIDKPVAEPVAARVSKRRTQFTANGSTVFVEQIAQFAAAAKDRIKAADDFAEAMEIEESFRRMIMGYCELM